MIAVSGQAAVVLVGRVLLLPFTLVAIPLLTRLLSPSEIGRMAVLMALQGWFGLLFIYPVGMYVFRRIVEWHGHGRLRQRLALFCGYSAAAAAAAALGGAAANSTIGVGIEVSTAWLMVLLALKLTLNSVFVTLSTGLNILNRRGWYVGLSVGAAWLGLLASAAFAAMLEATAEWWLVGQLAVEAALALIAWLVLRRMWAGSGPAPAMRAAELMRDLRRTGAFSWPLAAGVLLYWLQTQGYTVLLAVTQGPEFVGVFTVMLGVGSRVLNAFERLFSDLYLPLFYGGVSDETASGRTAAWNRHATYLFPSLLVVTVFAVAAGPWLALVLTDPRYHGAAWLASWGAFVEALRIATAALSLAFHAHLQTLPLIGSNALTGTLVFIGIGAAGLTSDPGLFSAAALAAGVGAGALYTLALARRRYAVRLPWERGGRLLLSLVPLIALSVWSNVALPSGTWTLLALLAASALYTAALLLHQGFLRLPGDTVRTAR